MNTSHNGIRSVRNSARALVNAGRPRVCVRWTLLATLCSSLVGCSDDGRLPTYEVTGKVVFADGTPLPGGWIIFQSPDAGLAARGVVEVDGTFRLSTYEEGDGAVAGRHLIAVTPASPPGYDPDQGSARPVLDPKYAHMDTSGLEVDVEPEAANDFTLTVEHPGQR